VEVLHIFLEFVSRGTITQRVTKEGPLCETTCRRYTNHILSGLLYLHNSNIIHRDIKGANSLISCEDMIKIADFGTAAQCGKFHSKKFKKIADVAPPPGFVPLPASTEHKALRGTSYYMAPEVIKGVGYGRRADVWSLGCTVVEMATGHPPWHETKNQVAAMYRVASGEEAVAIPGTLSTEGKNFLSWCFKRDPNDRATTKYLLEHPFAKVENFAKGLNLKHPPPPPPKRTTTGPLDMRTIVGGVGLPVDHMVSSGQLDVPVEKGEAKPDPFSQIMMIKKTRNKLGKDKVSALTGTVAPP